MCYTGKCRYEKSNGICELSLISVPPQDALCKIEERAMDNMETESSEEFKKDLLDLIISAEYVNMWLSAALDDPKVCEEMKSDIRRWLENLFEFKKRYKLPEMTLYSNKRNR